ncbi:hypothetical protein [Sulfuricurvum sp.]|uniref:hypothetical protein n=1 Tax=Sulfuricurvum sp. TaxID=2025608 RepID=UPI003BAF6A70
MTYNGNFLSWLDHRPMEQAIIAYRGKMTMHEMFTCLEISNRMNVAMEEVLTKMADFKETSAHILYKQEFLFV